jgi:D-alanine--poly(phosphoribitol) ligase subunit 2
MTETAVVRAQRVFEGALHVAAPGPDVDLIDAGLIDSLGLVTLLFELEQEFDVQLPLETLDVDTFRTLANIAQTLTSLQRGASA